MPCGHEAGATVEDVLGWFALALQSEEEGIPLEAQKGAMLLFRAHRRAAEGIGRGCRPDGRHAPNVYRVVRRPPTTRGFKLKRVKKRLPLRTGESDRLQVRGETVHRGVSSLTSRVSSFLYFRLRGFTLHVGESRGITTRIDRHSDHTVTWDMLFSLKVHSVAPAAQSPLSMPVP